MGGGVVAGQPPPQEPVQRNGVERGLERVVRRSHGVGHRLGPVEAEDVGAGEDGRG